MKRGKYERRTEKLRGSCFLTELTLSEQEEINDGAGGLTSSERPPSIVGRSTQSVMTPPEEPPPEPSPNHRNPQNWVKL